MPAAEVMLSGSVVNSVVAENILNNNNNNSGGSVVGGGLGNDNGSAMSRLRRPPPSHLPPLSESGVRCSPSSSPPASSPSSSGSFVEGNSGGSWNPELMSGSLTLVGPGNKHSQSVQVKVYRTSLEHFAVIYPQKKVCRPLGVLNLRNAHVERLCDSVLPAVGNCPKPVDLKKASQGDRMGFVVRQRGFDSPFCLTFLVEGPSTSPYAATLSGGPFSPRVVQRDLSRDLEQWMAAFRCAPGAGLSPSSPLPPGAFPSPPPSPVPSSPSLSPRGDHEGFGGTPPQQRPGRRCTAATRHHHQPPCLAIVEEEEV